MGTQTYPSQQSESHLKKRNKYTRCLEDSSLKAHDEESNEKKAYRSQIEYILEDKKLDLTNPATVNP